MATAATALGAVAPAGQPAPPRDHGAQRAANERAYEQSRAWLTDAHRGRWVVIAEGVVLASFEALDAALAAAERWSPDAAHRFVFRPGVDDGDVVFVQSPWRNEDPSWFQLGVSFRGPFPLTISSDLWIRGDKALATPGGRGPISLGAPGAEPALRARAVCSNLFEHDLTITGRVARELGLARFSVPGRASMRMRELVACDKVLCRVALPELGIDTTITAFVIPQELVERIQPVPSHPTLPGPRVVEDAEPDAWIVRGRVVDEGGAPLAGVQVTAHTGMATLRRTGEATTGADGRYELRFEPGMWRLDPESGERSVPVQAATITARLDGHAERELSRAGDLLMAEEEPGEQTAWGPLESVRERLVLRGRPRTLDFVMVRAATVAGLVLDAQGRPIERRSVAITGDTLPPSRSELAAQSLSELGTFRFDGVPAMLDWRIQVRIGGGFTTLETEGFRVDGPATRRVVVVVDPERSTAHLEPWTDETSALLARLELEAERRQVVRGSVPEREDPSVAWGPAREGLQAGLRLPGGGEYVVGDAIEVEVVVRNVGDEPITFESSEWRQEDALTLRAQGGRAAEVTQSWYSGWPRIRRYELHPGEEVVLESAPIGVCGAAGEPLGHPVVYDARIGPGGYTLSFCIRLPGVNRFDEREGDYRGGLDTGQLAIEVIAR